MDLSEYRARTTDIAPETELTSSATMLAKRIGSRAQDMDTPADVVDGSNDFPNAVQPG